MMAAAHRPDVFDLFEQGQQALKHCDFLRAATVFTAAAEQALTPEGRVVLEERARFAANLAEEQERKRRGGLEIKSLPRTGGKLACEKRGG